jgi:DNA-binding beta-propeller fold protein YncE
MALVSGLVACTETAAQDPSTTVAPTTTDPGASTTVTTESVPGPLADQTPPSSTFGIEFHDRQLWVVDFYLGEVLVVDPDSGTIIRRLKAEDNIADEVDNISVDQDGKLFWVGYNDGAVGQFVVSSNVGQVFARVDPGLCGVAISPDGKTLYVGGSMTGPAPFYAIDPLTREQKTLIPSLELRSFAVTPDGTIYGPRWGSTEPGATPGALIQIDPATGAQSEIVSGLDGPIAAEVSPDGAHVYVLSQANGKAPTLQSVNLATHDVTALPAPATPLVANLAVAPDGRIFVSSYNRSDISIIGKDGNVRTLAIGQVPPPR